MKKRILAWALTVCMAVSLLALPAQASSAAGFPDVADRDTAVAVEVLRLMGVVDGYGNGTFRPNNQLNRAQFCKMVTYVMNEGDALGLYRTVTVFPDVKPSHWAAPYINLAAKGKGIISGFGDGMFHPERPVTAAQASTILLRLLGYKEEQIGGVWPSSYLSFADSIGLTNGVGITSGGAPLTRGQAAKLFLNLLRAETASGATYLSTISTGTQAITLTSSSAGKLQDIALRSGKTPSGILNGFKGTLVLDEGKALTFVPDARGSSFVVTLSACTAAQIIDSTGTKYAVADDAQAYYNGETMNWSTAAAWFHAGMSATLYLNDSGKVDYVLVGGGSESDVAVIISANASSAGLDALTDGVLNYSIYKNGAPADVSDLRKNDVATYSAATNTIRVCDTRVSVYYESCEPSPAAPTKIRVLGGTEFNVLPTARDSVADFKPGQQMILLLTEGGQVAGAVSPNGSVGTNAAGLVRNGTVQLLCGSTMIPLAYEGDELPELEGSLVSVSSTAKGKLNLYKQQGNVSGNLDVKERTLGRKSITETAMIFRGGSSVALSQLNVSVVPENDIEYARTNWAGEVDLIILRNEKEQLYGRVTVTEEFDGETNVTYITLENGKISKKLAGGYAVRTGDYVSARINSGGTGYSYMMELTEYPDVSGSAWVNKSAVTVGGHTFLVPEDVLCYNLDSREWVTLDAARAYAATANLHVEGSTVRIVEVGG